MKDQPEDKFEQRIRERLQSLESDPPAGAWDRLAADLPPASPSGYRRWVALVVLLALTIGAALWWTLADQPVAQEKVARQPVIDKLPADEPLAADTEPSVESTARPYGLTKPTEASADESAKQSAREEPDSSNPSTIRPRRPTATARVSGDTDLLVRPDASRTDQEAASTRSSLDLSTSATYPSKTARYNANPTGQRTVVRSVAPVQPAVVSELSEVKAVLTPVNPVLKPLPSPKSSRKLSRWELWATANPMLLYQRVAPDVSDAIQVTSLNRTTFSQDRLGLQASAGGLYQINARLALKVGIYYRYTRDQWTYNYHQNATDSFRVVRVDENTVEATPVHEEQRGMVKETNHRVGALAGVQYRLSGRRFGNVLSAELQAQSLAEKPAWYAHVSYVAERKLSKEWSVHAGPSFLWNFSGPGNRSEHFVLKPYGFGIQVGVSYRLPLRR